MPSIRHAFVYSLGQRYLAFALQLATSVILARLLTPEETGIFSLAAAAVALGQLLREFGTGDYVISEPHLDRDKLRAAYAMTMATAFAIAAVMALVAQPLARSYQQPGVATILYLLSLNYLMLPLGSVALSVLHREMKFDKVLVVQTTATLVASIVTVAAALAHQSYLSPAFGSIAGIFATVACLAVISPAQVFMMPSTRGITAVLRFGGTLTMARLIEQGASKSADFIVSAMLGFHATGLLSKATSLLGGFQQFFSSAMTQVATPALSRAPASGEKLQAAYCNAVVLMSLAQWSFFGLMGIFGAELVQLLFGDAWMGAVPLMQLGAISGILWAPYTLYASVLTARREVTWQLRIPLIASPVLVLCYWLGALHSLEAVAALSVVATLVRLVVIGRALESACSISMARILQSLRPTALACAAGLAHGFALKMLMLHFGLPAAIRLFAGVVLALAVTLICAAWLRHPVIGEARRLMLHFSRAG